METLIHWIIFSSYILGIYTALIFLLYGLTFSHPRKNDKNEFVVKSSNIIIQYIYRVNIIRNRNIYPSNICQLFWGLFFSLPFSIIGIIFYFIVIILWGLLAPLIGFLLGYIPYIKKNVYEKSKELSFHRYQRYGITDSKKWIAPYKIIILLVLLYYSFTTSLLIKVGTVIWLLLSEPGFYSIVFTCIGIVVLIVLFILLTCSKAWQAIKQFFIDFKAKRCTLINLID
jgi:hypothetical protein